MLSLAKLEHFHVLARTGSFARGAAELGLSQPALSRSIASLEAECGRRLVDRERGRAGVSLTSAGVALLDDVDELLGHARRVAASITGRPEDDAVQVQFGIGPLLGRLLVTGALTQVVQQYPRATFSAFSGPPRVMRRRLLRGELDFFVAPVQVQPPDARIRTLTLGGQSQAFQVRRGHPLLTEPVVTAEAMAAFPLVSGTVWNELRARLDRQLAHLLRPRVEIDDFEVLVELVRATDAVLLFSVPVPSWGLVTLPVDFLGALRAMGDSTVDVHWRAGLALSQPAQALVEALTHQFSKVFIGLGLHRGR